MRGVFTDTSNSGGVNLKNTRYVFLFVLAFSLLFLLILLFAQFRSSDSRVTIPVSESTRSLFSHCATIAESKWYHLVEKDNSYFCYFYNHNNQLIRTEGPLAKLPKINLVNEQILYFSVQAGTGIGTQWGYFYDGEACVFSDVYSCIVDYTDHLVAYADGHTIIVCDIFNPANRLANITNFRYAFSDVAFPFIGAAFLETDSTIEITYLHGENFQQITEVFRLQE